MTPAREDCGSNANRVNDTTLIMNVLIVCIITMSLGWSAAVEATIRIGNDYTNNREQS